MYSTKTCFHFRCNPLCVRLSHKMYEFKPIDDLDGYIKGLRREGFYTEAQIEEIRKKHQDAKDAMRFRHETKFLKHISSLTDTGFVSNVNNIWECTVSVKGNKVKVTFPFAELDDWFAKHRTVRPPVMTVVKCLKLAGASRTVCEEVVKKYH